MKKLLGIVVLGLLLCENAYAKDYNLNCKYISGQNKYGTRVISLGRAEMLNSGLPTLDKVIIVNSKTKKILRQKYSGEFVPLKQNKDNFSIKWNDHNIIWTYRGGTSGFMADALFKTELNRSSAVLIEETFHGEKSEMRKQSGLTYQLSKFKCEVTEKIF